MAAVLIVVIWAVSGPVFHFSEAWQMVINTGTTIVTFLLVFLIQNTQNRDSQQMQIKMDELIRAVNGAHNRLLDLEDLEDDELDELHDLYQRIGARIGAGGGNDTGTPDVTPPPPKRSL